MAETGTAIQIQQIGDDCFSQLLLLRLKAHMGCQIKDTQQEQAQMTKELCVVELIYLCFNTPFIIGFLGRVETAISDPVRLLASMSAIFCVFQ